MFFALVLIGWGILGLIKGDFAPGWQPVPESLPARLVIAYLCAFICIACGLGLLFRQTAAFAARILFAWLLAWLLVLRVPWMFVEFGVGTWWAVSSTAVIAAAAWIIYTRVTNDWDRRHFGFVIGDKGLRVARILFGLGLIPFGIAHFVYLEATAPLVPSWLLWPVFWAYFTGGAFIVAGIAIMIGVFARLAAVLVTLQIGLLTLLVWVPIVLMGNPSAFQWGEVVVSIILTACAWVVADSYSGVPWLGASVGNRGKLS
ncbi:MAG TPA: hypothetical protein VEV84_12795 [Pyrinomonadaceae bacterium]|nr:hypothetical protein [Pyrinomonadaceae bacterium]